MGSRERVVDLQVGFHGGEAGGEEGEGGEFFYAVVRGKAGV